MNATFINEVLKQLEGKFDEKQLKTIERTLYRKKGCFTQR